METGVLQSVHSNIQNNEASDSDDDNSTDPIPTDPNMADEITSHPSSPKNLEHTTIQEHSSSDNVKDDSYVLVQNPVEENASSDSPGTSNTPAEIHSVVENAPPEDINPASRRTSNATGEIKPVLDEAPQRKEDPALTGDKKIQKKTLDSVPSQNDKSSDKNLCDMISEELKYMKSDPDTLQKYGVTVKEELDASNKDLEKLKKLLSDKEDASNLDDHQIKLQDSLRKELRELKRRVTKLKAKFPSKVKIHKLEKASKGKDGEDNRRSHIDNLVAQGKTPLFTLHDNKQFTNSEVFGNFESLYENLNSYLKRLCLLTFSVFPENAMIRKRIMIFWWMADGFIKDTENGSEKHYSAAKETCVEYLKEFTEKGFIIPNFMKPGSEPHSYQVHPMARIVLVSLANKKNLFDFQDGSPTEKYEKCLRACLVGEGLANSSDLKKLHMVFNVDESIVEFKPEWFPRMENLNILHLGRWQSDEKHHIEIDDPDLLDHLQHLKFLKFLSLQGVSRVTELPDSIRKLGSIQFLDLRACHNLEVIPTGLGDLKTLTHLDMSDCYLVDHLPKEISELKNLLVLKGFIIVGDTKDKKLKKGSCTLKDLAKSLTKLKKLGIYTSVYPIPNDEVEALEKFKELWTLSISWGSTPKPEKAKEAKDGLKKLFRMVAFTERTATPASTPTQAKQTPARPPTQAKQIDQRHLNLPESLVKLELNCYPEERAPQWLKREKLPKLKKLYIRGGRMRELGSAYEWKEDTGPSLTKNTWSVEILRLKYLACMDMSWREFQHLFPKLTILENLNCPKLTLFPTDKLGVWRATKQS